MGEDEERRIFFEDFKKEESKSLEENFFERRERKGETKGIFEGDEKGEEEKRGFFWECQGFKEPKEVRKRKFLGALFPGKKK